MTKMNDVLIFGNAYQPYEIDDEKIALSTKFLEVLTEFGSRWPGEVRYQLETGSSRETDMDKEVYLKDLPVNAIKFNRTRVSSADYPEGAMCLTTLEAGIPKLQNYVSNANLRLIRVSDNPPSIVRSIILLTENRSLKGKIGGILYTERDKWRYFRDLKKAASIQCNQFASYDYFKDHVKDRFVYIDTRIREGETANSEEMEQRKKRYLERRPLHLCYSGRLDSLKSPLDIAEIGKFLFEKNVPFRYSVFGDGRLRGPLESKTKEYGLSKFFNFHGFVDLREKLLPMMRNELDVFIGNHHQGDTSTTYPEMMSAGVPVVSYPNPAVCALQRHYKVTTHAAEINPQAMADKIYELHCDRTQLWNIAKQDYEWGRQQTIDSAYQKRVDHVLELRDRYRSIIC